MYMLKLNWKIWIVKPIEIQWSRKIALKYYNIIYKPFHYKIQRDEIINYIVEFEVSEIIRFSKFYNLNLMQKFNQNNKINLSSDEF